VTKREVKRSQWNETTAIRMTMRLLRRSIDGREWSLIGIEL
jgi:hypothetical protein